LTSEFCSVNSGRHARHPVDVEHVDGFHQVPQFTLGAGQDQHVAQLVRTHRLRILGEGLEDPQHFAHADVTQRDDLHRESWRQCARRIPELRRDVAADRRRLRHHHVQAAALDHRRAVGAQQRFQRRRSRVPRNARRGPDGHGTADRGIDRVILAEDVAQMLRTNFADRRLEISTTLPGGLHGGLVEHRCRAAGLTTTPVPRKNACAFPWRSRTRSRSAAASASSENYRPGATLLPVSEGTAGAGMR
jgi:hypothetical protein